MRVQELEAGEELDLIKRIDQVCFPHDAPIDGFDDVDWTILYDGVVPVAYCGWYVVDYNGQDAGFLYRSGVVIPYRGKGYQRRLIKIREAQMIIAGIDLAVSYTKSDNAAAMCNLIQENYKPYEPTTATSLVDDYDPDSNTFVHWRKPL